MTFFSFVMGLHPFLLPDILLINRVKDQAIDRDDHSLVHLIARHYAR